MATLTPEGVPVGPVTEDALQALLPPPRTSNIDPRKHPVQWAKVNLFKDLRSTLLTIVFGIVLGYILYRAFIFVFISGRWEFARVELLSFMVGAQYPRDAQSLAKLWYAIYLVAIVSGVIRGAAGRGMGFNVGEWLRRTWPILLGGIVLLSLTQTVTPKILAVGAVVAFLAARIGSSFLPLRATRRLWLLYVAAFVALLAILLPVTVGLDSSGIGTGSLIMLIVGVVLGGLSLLAIRMRPTLEQALNPIVGVAGVLVGLALFQNLVHIDLGPVDDWGGLLLTLFVSVAGITLSFPLGVLLALGRTSTFALIRPICVSYIELIRGVPLITLLFTGDLVLRFFLPQGFDPPGKILRATIMITLFTGAYTAEVVRGGLQSVPNGQFEAAKAIGLAPLKTTRMIVLPQALRNVIPALVGQFISLLKDTSLLVIIGVNELIGIVGVVTSQQAFRSQGLIAEALAFVGLIYWVMCYSMSKASQRLETRLGVGTR